MTCTIISTGKELSAETLNEYEPPYSHIKAGLILLLGKLHKQGFDCFYLNCDYGIPLWTAEIIGSMKQFHDIQLHIVIPYEEQAVHWPEEIRNRYFRVHERADSVTLASTHYHPDCYDKALQMMTEKSELLVICGKPDDFHDTAKFAETYGIKVFFYPVP